MDFRIILALSTIIASFLLSFTGILIYVKKPLPERFQGLEKSLAFAPYYLSCLILFSLAYWFSPTANDFVNGINFFSVFIPLLLAGVIYGITLFSKLTKFLPIAILVAITISTFLLPTEFLMFKGLLPFWLDRLCILVIWFLFSNFYYILNGVDGLLGTQTATIAAGLLTLSLLDAAPLFYGIIALSLLAINGSFLIFSWFPSRITLTSNSCKVLGFIIGWLLTFSSAENLAPCNFIFIIFYLLELTQASLKKISMRDKFESLTSNTTYYQSNISGLSPVEICIFLAKLQAVFIIISCFQLYAPNTYSLPILCLILGAWFLTKLRNWHTPDKRLRDLNKDFMEDIRQNIEEIKNNLGKN